MQVVLFIALIALQGVAGDEYCGEHGHLEGSVCACDNPWPEEKAKGWTGRNCTIPVYGGVADGNDMTAWCQADGCHGLEAGGWACWALRFAWNRPDDPWNYLAFQLARTSESGDPDLFGLFSGGSRGIARPNSTAKGYDFQETSSGQHPVVVKRVKRADFGADRDYEGAYACIRAYASGTAPISYSLRATLERCPSSFAQDGTPMVCHTPRDASPEQSRYSECTSAGECVCSGQYAKPVPEVFPGLGFDDCSAETTRITLDQFESNSTFVAEHQEVAPEAWRFYRFKVHQSDYQVVVNLAEESQSRGRIDAYMKFGQPPSWGPHQFDLRPDWNGATDDRQLEMVLDPTKQQFRAGDWYIGVLGDHEPANFTLTIAKYPCPFNCSGHGECVAGGDISERRCECREGYGGVDCSKSIAVLNYNTPVVHNTRSFEYDFYSLPEPTEGMKRGSVELIIEASFYSAGYTHHLDIFPSVLLAQSDNSSSFPSASRYAYKLVLDEQNTTRALTMCPSQMAEGEWKLAVYNPLRINSIAYNLTVRKEGRCLNACSGHGECSEDGVCLCTDNWSGGDCSVSLNASCLVGSRRAQPRPDQHGTCWQQCDCDEAGKECSFGEACADFTCDAAPQGERALRRKGSAEECVQDKCVKDKLEHFTHYICLRNCTCPEDGGPCTLDTDCSKRFEIGGKKGVSGGTVFFWVVFAALLGLVGAACYIHFLGVPAWLPVRARGFGGLYQELSEEGV